MTRRKPLLLLAILLVALAVAGGLGYLLLHREPVYGGKPRSYWKEHLAEVRFRMLPPDGWLQQLVRKVNPWRKPEIVVMRGLEACEASPQLLEEILTDSDPDLRRMALMALFDHYGASPEAWAIFLRAARDPDQNVRCDAILELGNFPGEWTSAIVEDYLGLLSDGDPSVRELAVYYCPQWLPEAREAVSRALQKRAKTRSLNADEACVLQALQQPPPAPRQSTSP